MVSVYLGLFLMGYALSGAAVRPEGNGYGFVEKLPPIQTGV
jgi:hypothetical protein